MKALKINIIVLLMCCSAALSGQSKGDYTFEKMEWQNPLLQSNNAAFMRLSDTLLTTLGGSFTDLNAGVLHKAGSFRNAYDPKSSTDAVLDVKSYTRLGKLYLSGSFGYDYTWMRQARLLGLNEPARSPFMLTDTIPGNASDEVYRLQAAAALPLGEKFTIATDLRYTAGMMAKKKDLRNLNTLMNFEFRPALSYTAGPFTAGVTAGIRRRTELIEYKQVDSSTEKYIFEISGLWTCNAQGYSDSESTRSKRYKQTASYLAGAALQYNTSNLVWTAQFDVDRSNDYQGETKYNNFKAGDYESLLLNGSTSLQFGLKHRLSASYSNEKGAGYKYLQRQELDPASMVRQWVDYARYNCYSDSYSNLDASYTFRQAESLTSISWEATAGFGMSDRERAYTEYPQRFCQDYRTLSASLSFTKYLYFNNLNIEITPSAAYTTSPDGTMFDTVNEDEGHISITSSGTKEFVLTSALRQEYGYLTADVLSAGLKLRLSRQLEKATIYGVINAGGWAGSVTDCTDPSSVTLQKRGSSSLTIGFIF